MIELGKISELKIARILPQGAYLSEDETGTKGDGQSVLLPSSQVPSGASVGSRISCFIYRDSEDRLIATTAKPLITLGEVRRLKIKEVSKIGAFLDIGLERDLLLPFSEQTYRAEEGSYVLASMYVDKSGRLAATMKIYEHLSTDSPYKAEDEVTGTLYQISRNFGAFVAVDDMYSGLIPAKEFNGEAREGERINARVTKVLEDGKLNLSIRKKAYLQMNEDGETLIAYLAGHDGRIPFTDKADPELIRETFRMSKAAFKRAVGHLLKEGRVHITADSIEEVARLEKDDTL
ncbi:MAG: S1 RNA-binding domain-containing protein [Lachnospiraceae bacterium]|nr:S1 RNA-binding domain-containing protein [Lachnospiraceae bacterium]